MAEIKDKLDPDIQNKIIQDTIRESVETHFPVVGKRQTLQLVGKLKLKDDLKDWDFPAQRELKLNGRSWHVPLVGTFRLVDNKTGAVVDEAKDVRVAYVPKMTNRFSMMIDGNEYTTMNQFRLKPGIYTRKKANDELESQFNLAVGYNFKLTMDPAEGIFYLYIANQKFHLYTLLHAFGMSESEMAKAWGPELFEKNKEKGINAGDKEIPLMWEKLRRQKLPYEEALNELKNYFEKTKLDVQTTELTIGQGFSEVTPQALLLTSSKLLRVMRGEEAQDERDSLIFKELNTVDDLLSKFFQAKTPAIIRNLTARADNKSAIREIISPDTYTKSIKDFFTSGDLSNPSPQTNPVEMVGEWRKTTITGTGGIQSAHAITFSTRDVQPSHLGFLDSLNTPESHKAGVTLPLAVHVKKEGNDIKTPIQLKSGEIKYITPLEFYNLKIGFPDQHKDGKASNKTIKAIYRGVSTVFKPTDIDGYLLHPTTMFAWTTNLVPFLGNNSGNRALVAAKMVTQSVPLANPESPLVKVLTMQGQPIDNVLGNFLNPKVPLDIKDAVVHKIDNEYITLKTKDGKTEKIGMYKDFPLNQESYLDSFPIVKEGDKVKSGQILARTNFNDKGGDYAPGINTTVAYMPWHGYNFEDGIVVTDSLAKRFTSRVMLKKTLQIDSEGVLNKKKFRAYFPEFLTLANVDKLDDEGIIKEGQTISSGEVLVAYLAPTDPTDTEKVLKAMNRLISVPYRNHSLTWDDDNQGVITHVRRVGNMLSIFVKVDQPLVVGDKLAARYGDKGIVTKIISDEEAPHTKDGTRIDIIVNPHGVIGRMNMGQILETAAGKLAIKTGKPYLVENFSGKNHLEDITKQLKANKIEPDEILYDGKDGKAFGQPIFWGVKHYLKLTHVVEHKYNARDLPGSYDANEQPVRGEQGGQAVDPLQTYAYIAHGARENLYEFAAVKGQKNDEYWRAFQLGLPPTPPQKNFVFDKMLAYMQAAGINIKKDGYKLQLFPATSKDVLKMSHGAIKDARELLRGKDLSAIEGGLFDPKLTGGMRGTNWTHMVLHDEMPNPLYEGAIKSLLDINGPQFEKIMNEETVEGKNTGADLIKKKLKEIDVNAALAAAKAALPKAPVTSVNSLNKKIRHLEVLKKFNLDPVDAYMMKVVPILPPLFRPVYPLPSGDIQVSPINKHYRQVSLINEAIKEVRDTGIDNKEFNKTNRVQLYQSLKAMVGLIEPLGYTKEKYEGLLSTLSGDSPKHGFVQNKVWSRRQDLSGRTTITVEPSLGIDEVGVPDEMLKKIFKPFIIREIVRQGFKPIKALEEYKTWSNIADSALNNVVKQRLVLLNRAPSLHKHSVQAFKPIRMEGLSMRINPLIAKGFNADLDGDVMSVHVPVSDKALEEAKLMLPSHNLFKAGDRSHMHNIDQDYQLGLYFLSKPGKDTKKKFASIEEVKKAKLGMQDVFTFKGKKTSLGQLAINSVLPKPMQDLGRVMDAKATKNLLEQVYMEHPNDFSKTIDHFKELGRKYAVERGTTLSITDLNIDRSFRDKILAKYDKMVKPNMTEYEVAELYGKAKTEIGKKQEELLKDNNRFYDMLNSGSSSKKEASVQILSMPGVIEDVHGKPIPFPIRKSWSEGFDTFDYWNSSYGARKGVVDRSVNTQESGALNKELLFNTKNLLIIEEDCGTPEGINVEVESKDAKGRYLLHDTPKVGKRNDLVTVEIVDKARRAGLTELAVRSPLTCESDGGVCIKCYGLMANGQPPRVGENVGVIDSQAVTERSTQLTMQTFHTGGAAGGAAGITKGFPRLEELMFVPKTITDAAVLAQEAGTVKDILPNPAGGSDLWIGETKYYIPRERKLLVGHGSSVGKGDRLTDGSIRPQDLSVLKDHLTAQQYVADEIDNVYENKFARRTFETVLRGISNNAEINDVPKGSNVTWIRGDVAPATTIKKINRGLVAEGKDPIKYTPYFASIDVLPLDSNDWLGRLTTNRLKKTLQDAAAEGLTTDLKGIDPLTAYLSATHLNQKLDPKKGQFY